MSLSELLNHISEGACLSEGEVYTLATQLRLVNNNAIKKIKVITGLILFIISVICFFAFDVFVGILVGIISIVIIYLMFQKRTNIVLITDYLDCVKKYYSTRFSDYCDFKLIPVVRDCFVEGENENRLCYLFSDGYEFYLFDDFLTDTEFELPKEFKTTFVNKPILKVFDANFIDKNPIFFKITDIVFYKANIAEKYHAINSYGEYDLYTKSYKKSELTSYVWLKLFNNQSYKFDVKILDFLRSVAKEKERCD